MIVGIDPSQRNTGVCVTDSKLKILESFDIKTTTEPLLESIQAIRKGLEVLMRKYPDALYVAEKQMPSAKAGHHLFCVQMAMLEEMSKWTRCRLAHPLPIQLRSFMKSEVGKVPETKSETVQNAKLLSSFKGRMSSHMADAYFLCRLGAAVKDGRYKYKLSQVELPLISWRVEGGQ